MFSSFKMADGWITALDLYSMQCHANLVVLSGCKSGMNQLMGADELLGLTRGFLYAGARSLLLSLWDVNDKSTSRFMSEFYQAWLAGQTKSAALRLAIQKVRAEEPHPYFWAPFLLVGNP
jgi:CHAT domain-containing protein